MGDIKLADAVIAVNVGLCDLSNHGHQEIRLFRYLDARANGYDMTWGACEARWQDRPDHRMGFLYEIVWTLVLGFRFDADQINEALQVVPEYRELHPLVESVLTR